MADKKITGEVIGIDLGTTFSCVAVAGKDRTIEIIANDQGNRTTPSWVAFSPASAGSERLIGEAAKNQATLNPRGTIFDVKRLIGKKFDDPEVQNDLKYLPYPVVERDGKPCVEVEVNGELKTFTPEEISAMVLGKMKETAESFLGKEVTNAVVTVPAYFNDSQRQATKDAGTISGLNVLRIINEPTAGALAYGVKLDSKRKVNILVYDLGGGTFDVSVLNIDNCVFQVLATGGNTHLGGGDFDQRVMDYFVDLIKRKYKKDISEDRKALGKLRRECERVKRVLSSQTQARVEIDSLTEGMDLSEPLTRPLTRARFEDLNSDLFEKTLEVVKRTLADAKVRKEQIDEIVLVGGSTRIPRVREMLKKAFDGKEPSKGINADEAVAYGAAVQGAMLSSDQDGVILSDVTPLSLGIGIKGDLMSVVIPRNTVIPTEFTSDQYFTVYDHQTAANINVYQGERALTKDCFFLGCFELTGIPPAPRGESRIEVTFQVDADGILKVTAKPKATRKSRSLTISSYKGNLSSREIERMVREAREMAEHDKREKERIDERNRLEQKIYDLNKSLEKSKIYDSSDEERIDEVKDALRDASEWLDENEDACMEDYEDKRLELESIWDRANDDDYYHLD
ncbi:unnamed protein product [Linum tenue]|uniref:Heat shock protein 70 n=1 Tax=Linum tenue TaxID=586396 RepID=A0AAV0N729_9ROSI|nr:unnamed protein product [Linum tenue]